MFGDVDRNTPSSPLALSMKKMVKDRYFTLPGKFVKYVFRTEFLTITLVYVQHKKITHKLYIIYICFIIEPKSTLNV